MWIPDWAKMPNELEHEIGSEESWKEVAENYRSDHPGCYMCEQTKATEGPKRLKYAHHILPVSAGGLNEDWNLMTLCHTHHNKAHGDISFPPWEPVIERLAVEADERTNTPTILAARVDRWLRGKIPKKDSVTCTRTYKKFEISPRAARKALNQLLEMEAGPVEERERKEGNSKTQWILRSECLTTVKTATTAVAGAHRSEN
jgi:hypothetical protein